MDFYNALMECLMKHGFHRLENNQINIWYKIEERHAMLINLVPERLPGQDRYNLAALYQEQKRICGDFMIKTGFAAECLMLLVFKDLPDNATRKEMEIYPDLWCISRQENCLLIYERQRTDFYGLREFLENFLSGYGNAEKEQRKVELQHSFTPVNSVLVLINIGVFIILSFLGNVNDPSFMAEHGALVLDRIVEGKEYYRILTSMFIHFGADHLFQNMLILLIMGCRLERICGWWKYLLIYMGSGIAGSIASLCFTLKAQPYIVSAGASGAIFGVLGGILGMILIDVVRKKRQRIKDIGMFGMIFTICAALSYGFFETGVDNAAHLGGLVGGLIITVLGTLIQ